MSANPSSSSPLTGSLLEGIEAPSAEPSPTPVARVGPRLPRVFTRAVAWAWGNRPVRYGSLAMLLLGLGLGLFLALRPVPQPDFAEDPIDDLLNYTLLTDEFNALPVDQRLELLRELIDRLKTMSGDDSAMMAAFAASIDTDKLRKQIEENASRLALDVWDKFALDYQGVPSDNRSVYLDQVVLDMTKLLETVGGVQSEKSDEQRLKEARDQAKRDVEMLDSGKGPTAGQLARMGDFMRNRVGSNSSPQQQARGMQLMRDMTRHLRGQDPVTGKP